MKIYEREEDEWISQHDALKKQHVIACKTLGELLSSSIFIKRICFGKNCRSNSDGCFFEHDESKILGPKSKITIQCFEIFKINISPEELYYYLIIAYQNYLNDGQHPEAIKLFADGLDFFRKACDIKGTIHKEAAQQSQ
ncbi:MAG: hypothetical protein Q4F00_14200 [bacterium]|nr:hypothetical protein [bacterium]